jgi:hypothetical protein
VPATGRARRAKPGAALRHRTHPDAWAWQVVSLSEVDGLGPYQIYRALRREDKAVSWKWVRRCIDTFLKFGHPQHKEFRETIDQVSTVERKWIKARILEDPDMYLDEVVDEFEVKFKRTITVATVSSAMQTIGQPGDEDDKALSWKVVQRIAKQRNALKRALCRLGLQCLDPTLCTMLDEMHSDERSSRRRRAWAPIGEPAQLFEHFHDDGKLRSLVALVNCDGFVLQGCEVIEGAIDDARFLKWATEKLQLVMKPYGSASSRNQILILDNAVIHHSPEFIKLLDDLGCIYFFLSPYSPDYNAIELCFKTVKDFLKRNRVAAMECPELALWAGMRSVTGTHMRAYFRHCGYPLPVEQKDRLELAPQVLAQCGIVAMQAAARACPEAYWWSPWAPDHTTD